MEIYGVISAAKDFTVENGSDAKYDEDIFKLNTKPDWKIVLKLFLESVTCRLSRLDSADIICNNTTTKLSVVKPSRAFLLLLFFCLVSRLSRALERTEENQWEMAKCFVQCCAAEIVSNCDWLHDDVRRMIKARWNIYHSFVISTTLRWSLKADFHASGTFSKRLSYIKERIKSFTESRPLSTELDPHSVLMTMQPFNLDWKRRVI